MLEGLEPTKKATACGVRKLYHSLDVKDKEILWEALQNIAAWTTTDLEKALRHRGVKISYGVIRKHRQDNCSCKEGWQDVG